MNQWRHRPAAGLVLNRLTFLQLFLYQDVAAIPELVFLLLHQGRMLMPAAMMQLVLPGARPMMELLLPARGAAEDRLVERRPQRR